MIRIFSDLINYGKLRVSESRILLSSVFLYYGKLRVSESRILLSSVFHYYGKLRVSESRILLSVFHYYGKLRVSESRILLEARQLPKVCAPPMCKTLGSYTTYMVSISNGSGYGVDRELGAL